MPLDTKNLLAGGEEMELTDDNVREYNEKILPALKNKEPLYSVVIRPRNYNVKRGENIEIDIYLTGLGIPDTHKLFFLFSSPNVIDTSRQGMVTSCIKLSKEKLNGKDMEVPVAGEKYIERHDIDSNGLTIRLPDGFFMPEPKFPAPNEKQLLMPDIMAEKAFMIEKEVKGEKNFDWYDPISISLKTLSKAKAGDYQINVTLTYAYQNIIKQASDKVEFHVTSWWDRNQCWIITLGLIIAFISLLVLTVTNIWFPISTARG